MWSSFEKKYKEAGYETPEMVFWNLRPSSSEPISFFEHGITFLSGFSAGMMKSFLEYSIDDMTVNPIAQLMATLKRYNDIKLPPSSGEEEQRSTTCSKESFDWKEIWKSWVGKFNSFISA